MTRAYAPSSVEEAVEVLADPDLGAVPVAGCTDLMVVDEATGRRHEAVVDILRIPELRGIEVRDGFVDIGAASSFTTIRENPAVREHLPILAEVAATVGAWQIQNRATIGGNIANASPAGDSLPVLLALDARLVLQGPDGSRTIPYPAMHRAYRETDLRRGELIRRVLVPVPPAGSVQRFRKVGTREAQAISKVVCAFAARREPDGHLVSVRIGAGSVAATPVRLLGAESAVEGRPPEPDVADRVAAFARAEVHPIDDVRSTAEYRRHVLGRVVRRMVLEAAEDGAS